MVDMAEMAGSDDIGGGGQGDGLREGEEQCCNIVLNCVVTDTDMCLLQVGAGTSVAQPPGVVGWGNNTSRGK